MSKKIILDSLEIYSILDNYQFVQTQHIYFCKTPLLIDITSFQRIKLQELLVVVYHDEKTAELCHFAQKYLNEKKPSLFAKITKISNRKEKHEVICNNGRLFIDNSEYIFNKCFLRAELEKIVPERLVINY